MPSFLVQPNKSEIISQNFTKGHLSFIEKTLRKVGNTIKTMYINSETSAVNNWMYQINPLVKVFCFILLTVVVSVANKIHSQLIATFFVVLFFLISKVSIRYIYKKIIFLSFVFGLLIFLPALLNVISPGEVIIEFIRFEKSFHFWIYSIPQVIGITDTGIRSVSLLFLRVFNSISLAMIFVYSTSFTRLIKGFKVFFIPDTFLMIISLAYKYIFILSKTIEESYFALKSKLFGNINNNHVRNIISGRIFFIFKKSKSNYEHTYNAMISRGYTGKFILHSEKNMNIKDICFLFLTLVAGASILFI